MLGFFYFKSVIVVNRPQKLIGQGPELIESIIFEI